MKPQGCPCLKQENAGEMKNIDIKVPLIVVDNNCQTVALHSRWFRLFAFSVQLGFQICYRHVRKLLGSSSSWCVKLAAPWSEDLTFRPSLVWSLQKVQSKSSSISKLPSSTPPPCWKTSQRGRVAKKKEKKRKSFRLVKRLNSLAFHIGLENRSDQIGTSLKGETGCFTGVWTCRIYCAGQTGSSPHRLAVSHGESCAKCC